MTIIIPANSAADTGYDIANSCRFDGSSAYLRKTFSGTSTDSNKCTMSFWCKRTATGENNTFLTANIGGSASRDRLYFTAADEIEFFLNNATNGNLRTNRLFRDPSAWYHVFVAIDTTQGTAANRVKLYVNGTQETSFAAESYPDEDYDLTGFGHSVEHTIGADDSDGGSNEYYNGYMAEVAFVNGVAHAVTDFGEFDEDSPTIWKPKDITSGITWGTNGFYLDFADSGDLGDDESGNTHDFAETNIAAVDQATDTPTNNFATWNSAIPTNSTMVLTEGNLNGLTGSNYATSESNSFFSTIGVNKGKWYAEFKYVSSSTNDGSFVGIAYDLEKNQAPTTPTNFCQSIDEGWGYAPQGEVFNNGGTSGYTAYAPDDIIGVAMNLDDNTVDFYKNGSSAGSQISIDANKEYFFALSDGTLSNTFLYSANFGSPAFTISSGNADGNGYGNFEYAVPSGYYALCTKNLAEYG